MTAHDAKNAAGADEGVVSRAWQDARTRFSKETQDPRKRALVETLATSQPHDALQRLLLQARNLHGQRTTGRKIWQDRLERAFQTIDTYACIGDVLAQDQGQPVNFVWGAIRACLKCAVADLETFQDLASNLIDTTEQLSSAEKRLLHFPVDEAVFDAAALVFAAVLRYLVSVIQFMQCRKPARAFKALSGGNAKLKRMFHDVEQRTSSLDRIVAIASEDRSRREGQAAKTLMLLPIPRQSLREPCRPEAGTCDWVARTPGYNSWKASGFETPLFIEGNAGFGKTTLGHFLCATADTPIKIFHSCYVAPRGADFFVSILRHLLLPIANSPEPEPWHTSVLTHSKRLRASANVLAEHDITILQEIVESIFFSIGFPPVTIVIDALSECRDAGRDLLAKSILRLAAKPTIRLVILTQHASPQIPRHFIKMDAMNVGKEVRTYVRARIACTPELKSLGSTIEDITCAKSSGMFLYAELLLDELKGAATLDDCRDILDRAPSDLIKYFDRLWDDVSGNLSSTNQCYREEILRLLVVTCEPLHTQTLAHYIALDQHTNEVRVGRSLHRPRAFLEECCRPFVTITHDHAEIGHPSMKRYIAQRIGSDEDPNAYWAAKCLSQLLGDRYASPMYAASALRRHLIDPKARAEAELATADDESVPYDYAVLHWQEHLFEVVNPSKTLLSKLAKFTTTIPMVSWSERLADLKGNVSAAFLNSIIDIRAALRSFIERLPLDKRKEVSVDDFFVKGHKELRKRLVDDDHGDRLIPYLPSFRLGQWYSMSSKSFTDSCKAYDNKKLVVDGFTKVLGKRNPLTLAARTTWVNEFWFRELILEAVGELTDIVEDYRSIRMEDKEPFLRALQNLGVGRYFLNNYRLAMLSLQESGAGLLKIEKEREWVYQVNDLYQGWVLERQGSLKPAQEKLESILRTWVPVAGESNGLSLMAKTALGSVYRKQERYKDATSELLFAWRERFKLFSIHNNTTIDSGVHLAIAFRDSGKLQEAEDILNQLKHSDVFKSDTSRQDQLKHVQSLIAYERGELEQPTNDLLKIIQDTTGTNRSRNNRECLWIRFTVAAALRYAGKDPESLMQFAEIVQPRGSSLARRSSPTLADEPEPPSQLEVAEQALRLVKDRDQAGAEKLLAEKGLQWVRERDFWIQQGGPPADTAWMREPDFGEYVDVEAP